MLLVLTLTEAYRQKRSLERVVQQQREASARIAGELDAAKRIQMATLPRTDFLRGDRRVDLAATMIPAREVGGDLYDFFRLDDRRLFLLVGDVAGKGLSASIFQAVSKALYKSTMLRAPDGEIGMLMAAANTEVSRDNPEMLFVTAFAAILDLETGELAYCNAGHDNPYLFGAADAAVRRIADGDGPPLCAVDDFVYDGARRQMQPGEWLCIVTDGVTEAQRAAGELYGGPRVEDFLRRFCHAHAAADAGAVVAALRADVDAFAAGAEPADDLTVLVLRWDGPRGAGAAVQLELGAAPRAAARSAPAQRPPGRPKRTDAPRGSERGNMRAVHRTTISTRRLRGSATPSGVGTSNSRLPRPTATMLAGARPWPISMARTVSARRSARASLVALLPTLSVCPMTTMSGTSCFAISASTPARTCFDASVN